MNDQRRRLLDLADQLLVKASNYILQALEEEQDGLDNLPENLQDSERAEKMQISIDCLDEALDDVETARGSLAESVA